MNITSKRLRSVFIVLLLLVAVHGAFNVLASGDLDHVNVNWKMADGSNTGATITGAYTIDALRGNAVSATIFAAAVAQAPYTYTCIDSGNGLKNEIPNNTYTSRTFSSIAGPLALKQA